MAKLYTSTESTTGGTRFLLAAVLQLYGMEERYAKGKHEAGSLFTELSDMRPPKTDHQKELMTLFPDRLGINLYVGVHHADKPTHYLPLIRNSTDKTFRVSHRQVHKLKDKPSRAGVLVSWGMTVPYVDQCLKLTPEWTRANVGNHEFDLKDFETRLQMTQAIRLLKFLCPTMTKAKPVYLSPGRISIHHTDNENDNYFDLEAVSCRRSVPVPKTTNAILGCIDAKVFPIPCRPFGIMCRLKEDYQNEDIDGATNMFASELGSTFIHPYFGIRDRETRNMKVYAMHYDKEREAIYPVIVKIYTHRVPGRLACYEREKKGQYIPNTPALFDIINLMLESDHKKRQGLIRQFFQFLSLPYDGHEIVEACVKQGIKLSDQEKARLIELAPADIPMID